MYVTAPKIDEHFNGTTVVNSIIVHQGNTYSDVLYQPLVQNHGQGQKPGQVFKLIPISSLGQ